MHLDFLQVLKIEIAGNMAIIPTFIGKLWGHICIHSKKRREIRRITELSASFESEGKTPDLIIRMDVYDPYEWNCGERKEAEQKDKE